MTRETLITAIASQIESVRSGHPTRVAIDGIDAAGKTRMADELAEALRARNRWVIRASIDGFHNPTAYRLARGPDSPEGYFCDSFNYAAVMESLLEPLGPGGSRLFRDAMYDYRTDKPVECPVRQASPNAILLMDGVFLLRPELRPYWDYSVFVRVNFEVALHRAEQRDLQHFESTEALRAKYEARYFPGQRIYFEACNPLRWASVVVDNNDFLAPFVASRAAPRSYPA